MIKRVAGFAVLSLLGSAAMAERRNEEFKIAGKVVRISVEGTGEILTLGWRDGAAFVGARHRTASVCRRYGRQA
ncbi:MAG: hypothetical protein HC844_19525 [Tabrizicola sp.]|nr:hypothetical protein [Tabrizicola sp.]